jgi:hypothetical protein
MFSLSLHFTLSSSPVPIYTSATSSLVAVIESRSANSVEEGDRDRLLFLSLL